MSFTTAFYQYHKHVWGNPLSHLVRNAGVHVNITPCDFYRYTKVNATYWARMVIYFDNVKSQKSFVSINANSFIELFLDSATFTTHINIFPCNRYIRSTLDQ